MSITVLTPTGTLGYGYQQAALDRGLSLGPHAIAVDAGSTDPGPHYLGSGETLVSRFATKRELTDLIRGGRRLGIPVIVGSAGGAGSRRHVDWTADIVREIAREEGLTLKLAVIYADIPRERVRTALERGEVRDFEAGFALTVEAVDESVELVAQMGPEPIIEALDRGADVVIAGRACDDAVIAAFPMRGGGDPALSFHMGKILECGAFSAEPFAMDVMMGTLERDHFVLEPGGLNRRASLASVAGHSLYEREDPFIQYGPGHSLDLSACRFEQDGERRVRVSGARLIADDTGYWVKLEGARRTGYRSVCVAGVRCPTMIARIDEILEEARQQTLDYFDSNDLRITYHVYGRDGVMRELEPVKHTASHELGVVMEAVARDRELAHGACHRLSGALLHWSYPGQFNTSGNVAFPFSPSELDAGAHHEFSAYHLMKAADPLELFPVHVEEVGR
jgi:hypothetical protein